MWAYGCGAGAACAAVARLFSSYTPSGLSENALLMFFFAGFSFVAAVFAWYARSYPMQDNYRVA